MDADNDPLTFSIEQLPSWAKFDASTGSLRGTPGAGDIGSTAAIRIGVSDGKDTAWLPGFSIKVLPPNVVITGTRPDNLEWDRLGVGKRLYLDDTPTLTRVPGEYRGLAYVRTLNADRFANAAVTIEFVVDRSVDVLVGYDTRATNRPPWLQSWTEAGPSLAAASVGHKLYKKRFEPGAVRLGGNELGFSMYSVVVDDGTGVGNTAPVLSGNPPDAVAATREYAFSPVAADIDGDPLTFTAGNLPAWLRINLANGELRGIPSATAIGTYDSLVITVSDGQSSASLPPFRIAVNPVNVNSPPAITGQPTRSVGQDTQYTFVPSASDPDGDALTFAVTNLPRWATFENAVGRIRGTPRASDVGTSSDIVIEVSDGKHKTSLPAFSITVIAKGATNTAPTITGNPPNAVAQGASYSFTPTANDADGDVLSFTVSNRPSWAAFNSITGRLSGTPGTSDIGPFDNVAVHVSDGKDTVSLDAFSITVTAATIAPPAPPPSPTTNSPPTISGTPVGSVLQDQPYGFTPIANDPNGDTLTFTISNSPSWATFNSTTGRLSGTPGANHVGAYNNVTIRVSDGTATTSLASFGITVGAPTPPPPPPPPPAPNVPPTISGTPTNAVVENQTYTFTPSANDADGDTLTFTITNRPSWATFNTGTGRLNGTPTASHVGAYNNIMIRVSDGDAAASLPPFNISVTAAPRPNSPPTISGTPASTVTVNQAYAFTPSANDPDGNPLNFTIANRPSWAAFNTATGLLSGTPSASHVGVYNNIAIGVSDGIATTLLGPFAVTVAAAPNAPPTISGTPSTTATENQPYTFTPSANDADGNTLTFTITNRPSWATFSGANGRLSGTPTASHVGVHGNITIRVSDSTATASLPAFSITVAAAPPPPNSPPTISGTPSTSVMVDQPYVFTPSVHDEDDDPLTFTISNRPPWAAFDSNTGGLSGTPRAGDVATYTNIVIRVSDGDATASLAAFAIQVVATATGSATLSWTAPTTNTDGSALRDLAGFKIYWGRQRGNYPNSATINNPGVTTYVVDELTPAPWYFVVTAFDTSGNESDHSNEASKTISP